MNCLLFGTALFLKYLHKNRRKAKNILFWSRNSCDCRSQWLRGLRRRSAAARLLRLWVRIPPGHGCLSVVSVVCCQRSLRRADHSSRGVLPTAGRRCVWFGNLVNEEALTHWGLLRQKENSCDWKRVICREHINMFRKQRCFLSLTCYKCETVGDFLSLSYDQL